MWSVDRGVWFLLLSITSGSSKVIFIFRASLCYIKVLQIWIITLKYPLGNWGLVAIDTDILQGVIINDEFLFSLKI